MSTEHPKNTGKSSYSPGLLAAFEAFKKDEFLQQDLDVQLVQEAIKHWLGVNRLPSDVAERKFNEDYRVLQTFGKVQNLQHACAREGATFPLELVLRDFKKPSSMNGFAPAAAGNPVRSEGKTEAAAQDIKGSATVEVYREPVSATLSNEGSMLEGVLRKTKSEPRVSTKEPAVRFANPPKQVEVRFAVEKSDTEDIISSLLQKPWFSMEPSNVAAWWGLQFLIIGIWVSLRMA